MAVQYHAIFMVLKLYRSPNEASAKRYIKEFSVSIVVYHYVDDVNMAAIICTLYIVLQIVCSFNSCSVGRNLKQKGWNLLCCE